MATSCTMQNYYGLQKTITNSITYKIPLLKQNTTKIYPSKEFCITIHIEAIVLNYIQETHL